MVFQKGNTKEQIFHAWESFSFDENAETVDGYVTHIRHIAALLRLWRAKYVRSI